MCSPASTFTCPELFSNHKKKCIQKLDFSNDTFSSHITGRIQSKHINLKSSLQPFLDSPNAQFAATPASPATCNNAMVSEISVDFVPPPPLTGGSRHEEDAEVNTQDNVATCGDEGRALLPTVPEINHQSCTTSQNLNSNTGANVSWIGVESTPVRDPMSLNDLLKTPEKLPLSTSSLASPSRNLLCIYPHPSSVAIAPVPPSTSSSSLSHQFPSDPSHCSSSSCCLSSFSLSSNVTSAPSSSPSSVLLSCASAFSSSLSSSSSSSSSSLSIHQSSSSLSYSISKDGILLIPPAQSSSSDVSPERANSKGYTSEDSPAFKITVIAPYPIHCPPQASPSLLSSRSSSSSSFSSSLSSSSLSASSLAITAPSAMDSPVSSHNTGGDSQRPEILKDHSLSISSSSPASSSSILSPLPSPYCSSLPVSCLSSPSSASLCASSKASDPSSFHGSSLTAVPFSGTHPFSSNSSSSSSSSYSSSSLSAYATSNSFFSYLLASSTSPLNIKHLALSPSSASASSWALASSLSSCSFSNQSPFRSPPFSDFFSSSYTAFSSSSSLSCFSTSLCSSFSPRRLLPPVSPLAVSLLSSSSSSSSSYSSPTFSSVSSLSSHSAATSSQSPRKSHRNLSSLMLKSNANRLTTVNHTDSNNPSFRAALEQSAEALSLSLNHSFSPNRSLSSAASSITTFFTSPIFKEKQDKDAFFQSNLRVNDSETTTIHTTDERIIHKEPQNKMEDDQQDDDEGEGEDEDDAWVGVADNDADDDDYQDETEVRKQRRLQQQLKKRQQRAILKKREQTTCKINTHHSVNKKKNRNQTRKSSHSIEEDHDVTRQSNTNANQHTNDIDVTSAAAALLSQSPLPSTSLPEWSDHPFADVDNVATNNTAMFLLPSSSLFQVNLNDVPKPGTHLPSSCLLPSSSSSSTSADASLPSSSLSSSSSSPFSVPSHSCAPRSSFSSSLSSSAPVPTSSSSSALSVYHIHFKFSQPVSDPMILSSPFSSSFSSKPHIIPSSNMNRSSSASVLGSSSLSSAPTSAAASSSSFSSSKRSPLHANNSSSASDVDIISSSPSTSSLSSVQSSISASASDIYSPVSSSSPSSSTCLPFSFPLSAAFSVSPSRVSFPPSAALSSSTFDFPFSPSSSSSSFPTNAASLDDDNEIEAEAEVEAEVEDDSEERNTKSSSLSARERPRYAQNEISSGDQLVHVKEENSPSSDQAAFTSSSFSSPCLMGQKHGTPTNHPSSSSSVRARSSYPKIIGSGANKACNCKKSKCLKLYCECFARGVFDCCRNCNCIGCNNQESVECASIREKAIKLTLERDPLAFFRAKAAAAASAPVSSAASSGTSLCDENVEDLAKPRKGCHCKKSGCLKKYCECFQAGMACNSLCKCMECKNRRDNHGPHHKKTTRLSRHTQSDTTIAATVSSPFSATMSSVPVIRSKPTHTVNDTNNVKVSHLVSGPLSSGFSSMMALGMGMDFVTTSMTSARASSSCASVSALRTGVIPSFSLPQFDLTSFPPTTPLSSFSSSSIYCSSSSSAFSLAYASDRTKDPPSCRAVTSSIGASTMAQTSLINCDNNPSSPFASTTIKSSSSSTSSLMPLGNTLHTPPSSSSVASLSTHRRMLQKKHFQAQQTPSSSLSGSDLPSSSSASSTSQSKKLLSCNKRKDSNSISNISSTTSLTPKMQNKTRTVAMTKRRRM